MVKKILLMLLAGSVLLLSGCVYQNVTVNSSKRLPDGTEVEMTSRSINFAFSKYIESGISKIIGMFVSPVPIADIIEAIPQPVEKPVPVEPPAQPPADISKRFDHYNPVAFEGKGVAIVFCTDSPAYDSCSINDQPMYYHGLDTGRHTWRNFSSFLGGAQTNVGGVIECSANGKVAQFEVQAHGKQCGSCRRGGC